MRTRLLLSTLVLAGCAAEESHPAEYQNPDASMPIPRTCDEARKGEVKQGNAIWLAGAPAGCGAVGQLCPIFDVDAFASVCKLGTPYGECQAVGWMVLCDLDAGLTDAATD